MHYSSFPDRTGSYYISNETNTHSTHDDDDDDCNANAETGAEDTTDAGDVTDVVTEDVTEDVTEEEHLVQHTKDEVAAQTPSDLYQGIVGKMLNAQSSVNLNFDANTNTCTTLNGNTQINRNTNPSLNFTTFTTHQRHMRRRPITSYGIILFTVTGKNQIKYLLCQRRDSISYAEFLKGTLKDEDIPRHIALMSSEERQRCLNYFAKNDMLTLWKDLWINHKSRCFRYDFKKCKDTFMSNMNRYKDIFVRCSLEQRVNEWGFPKGRKQSHEREYDCAMREFEEETKISKNDIVLERHFKPEVEHYTGTDGKSYRTILYVAYIPYEKVVKATLTTDVNIRAPCISEEIGQQQWMTYSDALSNLNDTKQRILKKVNSELIMSHRRRMNRRHFTY